MATVPSTSARVLLALTCLILVLARASGAHLHLCFDGSEPPASVHLSDDSGPDLPGVSGNHSDEDVSLIGDLVVKKAAVGIDLLPMLIAGLVLFGTGQDTSGKPQIAWHPEEPTLPSAFELYPPPRGPPSNASNLS